MGSIGNPIPPPDLNKPLPPLPFPFLSEEDEEPETTPEEEQLHRSLQERATEQYVQILTHECSVHHREREDDEPEASSTRNETDKPQPQSTSKQLPIFQRREVDLRTCPNEACPLIQIPKCQPIGRMVRTGKIYRVEAFRSGIPWVPATVEQEPVAIKDVGARRSVRLVTYSELPQAAKVRSSRGEILYLRASTKGPSQSDCLDSSSPYARRAGGGTQVPSPAIRRVRGLFNLRLDLPILTSARQQVPRNGDSSLTNAEERRLRVSRRGPQITPNGLPTGLFRSLTVPRQDAAPNYARPLLSNRLQAQDAQYTRSAKVASRQHVQQSVDFFNPLESSSLSSDSTGTTSDRSKNSGTYTQRGDLVASQLDQAAAAFANTQRRRPLARSSSDPRSSSHATERGAQYAQRLSRASDRLDEVTNSPSGSNLSRLSTNTIYDYQDYYPEYSAPDPHLDPDGNDTPNHNNSTPRPHRALSETANSAALEELIAQMEREGEELVQEFGEMARPHSPVLSSALYANLPEIEVATEVDDDAGAQVGPLSPNRRSASRYGPYGNRNGDWDGRWTGHWT